MERFYQYITFPAYKVIFILTNLSVLRTSFHITLSQPFLVLGSSNTRSSLVSDLSTSQTYINGFSWCSKELCTKEGLYQERKLQSDFKLKFNSTSSVTFNNSLLVELSFVHAMQCGPKAVEKLELVIITTSYGYPPHYSLSWIDLQPWPVFISTKEKNFGISSEPWGNVGQEITSYVRFILLFWDHLPKRIAFVHGHEKSWHQEGYRSSYILRNLCYESYDYINLSPYEGEDWMKRKGSMNYYNILKKYWFLVKPYLGQFPRRGFKEKCCAQFMVTRERIQQRPRALYELILREMSDKKKKYHRAPHGKNSGWDLIHFWEAIWHYIMGEKAIVNTRRKYGYGIDLSVETGLALNKKPERTLKNVVACPTEVGALYRCPKGERSDKIVQP